MERHDPRCFTDPLTGRPWPGGPRHLSERGGITSWGNICVRGGQILDQTDHWITNPFSRCNFSELDGWCYLHSSWDCSRLFNIWCKEFGVTCGVPVTA